uniref:Uncharacterized protein n=1 Tax=Opuntia streptacantha TaxID=393608 RepID=A0A7C9D9E7_OPUST
MTYDTKDVQAVPISNDSCDIFTSLTTKRRQIGWIGLIQFSCSQARPTTRPQEPTQTGPNNPNKEEKTRDLERRVIQSTLVKTCWRSGGDGFPLHAAQPTWFTMCLVGLRSRTHSQPYMQLVISFRSTRDAKSICMWTISFAPN